MADSNQALTGPPKLDLTGMRAGDVVDVDGAFYDVRSLDVNESVDGRDTVTKQALYRATTVRLKLERAYWLAHTTVEPSSVLALMGLRAGRMKINGLAYFVHSVSEQLAYTNSGAKMGDGSPEHIEVTLIRNAYEDDVQVIQSATLDEVSLVDGKFELGLTDVEFGETDRG